MDRLCHNSVIAAFFLLLGLFPMSAVAQSVQLEQLVHPESSVRSAGMEGVDPAACVGLPLAQVLETFGAPDSVFAVRGPDEWQDDVVFRYKGLELYLFRDHVWQARSDTAQGLRSGDSREAVIALLGEPLLRLESSFPF